MTTIVSEKGQITIPKAARDRLGLLPGTRLVIEVEAGRLIGRKTMSEDPIAKWRGRGHLPHGKSVDGYLKAIR